MSIESRLVLTDPELSAAIGRATHAQRHDAALALARWIIARSGLTHSSIDRAIKRMESGAAALPLELLEVEQLVAALDSDYFELLEEAEEGATSQQEAMKVFAIARAASSIHYALSYDMAEAAYEAIAATNKAAEVRGVVMSALSALH